MMKKLLIILTMLVYGLSATGATIHLHYCCGELESVSLSATHNKDCPEKSGDYKPCCDNKQVDLKIKADQNLAAKWVATFADLSTACPVAGYQGVVLQNTLIVHAYSNGPPVHRAVVPLYIKHCIFRI